MISIEPIFARNDNQDIELQCAFPFFAWQCLTLHIKGRCVDLVIKEEQDMDLLIGFLVHALNTIDGVRNSVQFYAEAATFYEVQKREREMNKKKKVMRKLIQLGPNEEYDGPLKLEEVSPEEKEEIRAEKKREMLRQTLFKFKLMRIRSKISYAAFKKRMPI